MKIYRLKKPWVPAWLWKLLLNALSLEVRITAEANSGLTVSETTTVGSIQHNRTVTYPAARARPQRESE